MKSEDHACRPSGSAVGRALMVLAASLAFVPAAHAERFVSRQSWTTESVDATTNRTKKGAVSLKGHLESKGVGVFTAGSAAQEVITVAVSGDFQGDTSNLTGKHTQTISFADGSTLKLSFEGSAKGKKFTAKIVGAEGTGRFQGVRSATGSLNGNVIDPDVNYVEVTGNYDLR